MTQPQGFVKVAFTLAAFLACCDAFSPILDAPPPATTPTPTPPPTVASPPPPSPEPTAEEIELCKGIVDINTKRVHRLPILRAMAFSLEDCGIPEVKASRHWGDILNELWAYFADNTGGTVTPEMAFGPVANYLWPIMRGGEGFMYPPGAAGPHGGTEEEPRASYLTAFGVAGPTTMAECLATKAPPAERRKLELRKLHSGVSAIPPDPLAPGSTYWDYFPFDKKFELGVKNISYHMMGASIESMLPELMKAAQEGRCVGKIMAPYGPNGFDWEATPEAWGEVRAPKMTEMIEEEDEEVLCREIASINTKRVHRLPMLRALAFSLEDCGIKEVKASKQWSDILIDLWTWFDQATNGTVTPQMAFGPVADYLWPIMRGGEGFMYPPGAAGPHGGTEEEPRASYLTAFGVAGPTTIEECMAKKAAPPAERRKLAGAVAKPPDPLAPGSTYWDYFPFDQKFELGVKKISYEMMAASIESMLPAFMDATNKGLCKGKVMAPFGPDDHGFDW